MVANLSLHVLGTQWCWVVDERKKCAQGFDSTHWYFKYFKVRFCGWLLPCHSKQPHLISIFILVAKLQYFISVKTLSNWFYDLKFSKCIFFAILILKKYKNQHLLFRIKSFITSCLVFLVQLCSTDLYWEHKKQDWGLFCQLLPEWRHWKNNLP